jgi:hypothetical protein
LFEIIESPIFSEAISLKSSNAFSSSFFSYVTGFSSSVT